MTSRDLDRVRFAALALVLTLGCEARASLGSTCARDSECAASLTCIFGRCRAECRASRDCPLDERCLVETSTGIGVCSLGEVDACVTGSCAAGLACRSGQCVNLCGDVVSCPDGTCVGDTCVPNRTDAGAPDDAGASDAGTSDAGTCHGPSCDPVVALDIGDIGTSAVVTASGRVWMWGIANNGILGDGLVAHASCADCSATPVQPLDAAGAPFFTSALDVAVGEQFACALDRAGHVYCWGVGDFGQLGDGTSASSLVPHQVLMLDAGGASVPLDGASALRAGTRHACVVRAGEAWCWGDGTSGQLGDGGNAPSPIAVRASALGSGVRSVYPVGNHTFVHATDGTVRGVGRDECSVLGTSPDAIVTSSVAPPIVTATSFASTSIQACALDASGLAGCWGADGAGLTLYTSDPPCTACGAGRGCTPMPQRSTDPLPTFVTILAGSPAAFFGLDAAGRCFMWGGDSERAPLDAVPAPIGIGVTDVVVDADAGENGCVLTALGDVLCWGHDDHGQLGRGTVATASTNDFHLRSVVWP